MKVVEYGLIYVILSISWSQIFSCNTTLQELVTQFCPDIDFCYQNASSLVRESCCNRCYCGEECQLYGTCCPDAFEEILYASPTQQLRPTAGNCASSVVKPATGDRQIEAKFYRIIDTCPNDIASDEKFYCEKNQTTLYELAWVSDETTGKIFKNRHCAQCNDIKNFISWNLRTDCSDVLTENLRSLSDVLRLKNCNIFVEAPEMLWDRLETNKLSCSKISGYSRCNVTGNWGEYDSLIGKACEASEWRFGLEHKHVKIHKNIFCYACNVHELSEIPSLCDPSPYSDPVDSNSFSVLLAYDVERSSATDEVISTTSSCGISEIENKHLKTCLPVFCPTGSLVYFGTCKNVFQEIDNLRLQIAISVKPVKLRQFWNGSVDVVLNELHNFTDIPGCSWCKKNLYIDNEDGNFTGFVFYADFIISRPWKCALEFIRAKLEKVVQQKIVLHHGNETDIYHVAIDIRPNEMHFQNVTSFIHMESSFYWSDVCSASKLRLMSVRSCPEVQLSYKNVIALPSKLSKRFLTFFNDDQRDDGNSSVRICLQEYNSILAFSNAKSLRFRPFLYLCWVLIVLV